MDAKKCESGWTFRPFQRKLAGAPPGVAYIGLRWSWTPRIWDPQASRANLPVTYTSPNLPSWLSWNEDTLSGIPSPDAESCDVTVEARVGGSALQYVGMVLIIERFFSASSFKTERTRCSPTRCTLISPR